jgi:hypothetical protein
MYADVSFKGINTFYCIPVGSFTNTHTHIQGHLANKHRDESARALPRETLCYMHTPVVSAVTRHMHARMHYMHTTGFTITNAHHTQFRYRNIKKYPQKATSAMPLVSASIAY